MPEINSLLFFIMEQYQRNMTIDKDRSQLLFRVISDSYENKSLILTTNL